MIKLFVTDLDGTLLYNPNKEKPHPDSPIWISEANKIAIKRLYDSGVKIAVASGRNKESIWNISDEIGIRPYTICTNGSHIMKNAEKLYSSKLNDLQALQLIKDLDSDERVVAYFGSTIDHFYNGNPKTKGHPNDFINNELNDEHQYLVKDVSLEEAILNKKTSISNITLIFDSNRTDLNDIRNQLKSKYKKMEFAKSGPYTIDVTAIRVDKGSAVDYLRAYCGFERDEVAVVGDSGNDIAMFTMFESSYCMNHSDQFVKNFANFYVEDVAEAIKLIEQSNIDEGHVSNNPSVIDYHNI